MPITRTPSKVTVPPLPTAPVLTVVTAPSCHLCHDALDLIATTVPLGAVRLEVVDASGEQGRALVALHRPAMAPLVLLEGRFVSSGRLSPRVLRRALQVATTPVGA